MPGNKKNTLTLNRSGVRVVVAVAVAMVMLFGAAPVLSASVSSGGPDGAPVGADPIAYGAAKARTDESGFYKVTVNYKKVDGKKKPKSVNIVGSKTLKGNITIPARLKVKIKLDGKTKTYNLPVVYLEKLDYNDIGQYDNQSAFLYNAKYLKKIGPIKYLLVYQNFLFYTRSSYDYPNNDLDANEVFTVSLFGNLPYDKKKAIVPNTIFNFKVVGFDTNYGGHKEVDISNAKHIRVLRDTEDTNFFCNGYILRVVGSRNLEGKIHSTVRIIGTYSEVADPAPDRIYGLIVERH
jgi:hypothetical protein